MRIDLADPLLFGNDAGEDEVPEVLASYFVEGSTFDVFWDVKQKIRIARARKGMGKSALLAKLAYDLKAVPNAIVVSVTGADLTGMGEFSSDDPAILTNQWLQVICARVNVELGRRIGWAGSDTKIMLVEASELAGFRGRNFIGALADRFKSKSVELQKLAVSDHAQLLKRFVEPKSDFVVWLLVDDIDSKFVNTEKMRNKASAFFSACRRLVNLVDGVRVRATVRADVWPVLRDSEDLDKCEQYITDIRWSRSEMENILGKKILAYYRRNYPGSVIARDWDFVRDQEKLIELAFARRILWGGAHVPTLHAVNILAAKRPRWLSQLCRLAGEDAVRLNKSRVDLQCINLVLPKFGGLRLDDIAKEHAHQYSDVKRLVESFSQGERTYKTSDLLKRIVGSYMSRVGVLNLPQIEGKLEVNALSLAHFLFKTGFIQGRTDVEMNPVFVDYDERPSLLQTSVNVDDGLIWEVHPSYRGKLQIF
ncbi:P-loop ATPase, Sll1717 family [Myxococcus faecalis]|uniref:P-loop ATPase, Sll1717 family n=1 Tax=Myxococcus faecalis TaxID=3115646 RepID=UPI0038D21D36